MAAVRARDGCVVETAGLAVMLRDFVDEQNKKRPACGGQFASDGDRVDPEQQESPLAWLAQETGIPEETLEVLSRIPPRYRTTELWIADRIATAVDQPHAFHDGTLKVQGNSLARLQLARSESTTRLAYRARIVFAGHQVGRVQRPRGGSYRAFVGSALVAEAASMAELRANLHSRVAQVACCGGSTLTGVVEPF